MEQHPNTKTGFTGRLLPENSLLATFVLNFQLISPLELGNLAEALGHLALGSHMVHFASMADLAHHDIHQHATLSHI
jgi:hypothetical protein